MEELRLIDIGHGQEYWKELPVWQKKGIGWAVDKNWTTLGVLIGKQRMSHSIWDEEAREYLLQGTLRPNGGRP